jgi:glycosyltransferase involved in cell wall biosynthesis
MHVVQALAALSVGGSEFVATELTEYLVGQGVKVTVLAAPGPLQERVEAAGADILPWPVNRKRLGTLRYIGKLRRWLKTNKPDLVHVHSRLPALLTVRALRGLPEAQKPALVTSMHGHYSVSRYSGQMAQGDAVIAVSEAIRDYTLHNYPVEPERVHVIHGGASHAAFPYGYQPPGSWMRDTLAEFPELKDKRWLCLPGRLSRYKGHAPFINLISALSRTHPGVHGIIVGAGRAGSRYHDELVGLAVAGGVRDRITFTGERQDIREWMAASELVFNLCSDPPEAFGRTVLEALYLGRPMVAWNHGGVAEILARIYPFGAVPPDNGAALLAQTATFLSQAPPVPKSDAFTLESSMHQTLELYRSLLHPHNPEDHAR